MFSTTESILKPVHLAIFFCERAFTQYCKERGSICDDLGEWCLQRTALFHQLPSQGPNPSPHSAYDEFGEGVLLDFLAHAWTVGGDVMFSHVLKLLQDDLHWVFDESIAEISVHLFASTYMQSHVDMQSVQAAINSFSRYRVWIYHAWTSTNFEGQHSLVKAMTAWLRTLINIHDRNSIPSERLSNIDLPLSASNSINVKALHSSLQPIFEGQATYSNLIAKLIFVYQSPLHTAASPQLLDFFNENAARSEELSNGPQGIMVNIACGMLLYEKKYLQLRSLENALSCAEGSVLIEHQFYTSTVIALSHLSCFEVHLACGDALKAADSLGIGFQLVQQRRDTVEPSTVSLFYIAAAQLLLCFPGVVSSSLRSLFSAVPSVEAESQSTHVSLTRSKSIGEGGKAIQSVAESVEQALVIAESPSLGATVGETQWKAMILSLECSTARVVGSMYGIVSAPLPLTKGSIQSLVTELRRLLPSSLHQSQELGLVLPAMSRLVAHTALALQEGTLDGDTPPLHVVNYYFEGISQALGHDGLHTILSNFFLRGVCNYLLACWQVQHGFYTAAYDTLTDLVSELYFQARIHFSCSDDAARGTGDIDQSSFAQIKQNGTHLFYWPPDHLNLFTYAQMKRAEVASYLGFVGVVSSLGCALKLVSSRCQFTFGILAAQYVELLNEERAEHYTKVIDISTALENSAKRIGLVPFLKRCTSHHVAANMKIGALSTVLSQVGSFHHSAGWHSLKYYVARLTCMTAIARSAGAPRTVYIALLRDAVEVPLIRRLLCSASAVDNQLSLLALPCADLMEVMCLHAALFVALQLGQVEPEELVNEDHMGILKMLQHRHSVLDVWPSSRGVIERVRAALAWG